jgi:uncharacterized membrane protein
MTLPTLPAQAGKAAVKIALDGCDVENNKPMGKARDFLRWLLGLLFVIAGANHFIHTGFYVSIMPPYLPWHATLVYLSGVAEMALGAMLLFRRTEAVAAWGTIALIVAVTPANIHMALHPTLYPAFSAGALLARLPLQGVLIAWAFWFTRPRAG